MNTGAGVAGADSENGKLGGHTAGRPYLVNFANSACGLGA